MMRLIKQQSLKQNVLKLLLLMLLSPSSALAHNGKRHTSPQSSPQASPKPTLTESDHGEEMNHDEMTTDEMNHDEMTPNMQEMETEVEDEVVTTQNQSLMPTGLGESILFLMVATPLGLLLRRK